MYSSLDISASKVGFILGSSTSNYRIKFDETW